MEQETDPGPSNGPARQFREDPYPTTKELAAAIKNLPRPGPNVPPQTVEIVAGPRLDRYVVTFVARQNAALNTPAWFWGIENSERVKLKQPTGD